MPHGKYWVPKEVIWINYRERKAGQDSDIPQGLVPGYEITNSKGVPMSWKNT